MVALIGHTFGRIFGRRRHIHRLEVCLGRRQGLGKRCRIALVGRVQLRRHHRAGVQIHRVLGLVGQVRGAVLHLGDLGLGVAPGNPVLILWCPGLKGLFFFILIGAAVFSYSPRIVMWTGATAVIAWTLGALWIAGQPETTVSDAPANLAEMTDAEKLAFVVDPNRVDIGALVKVDLVFLIVAGVLAAAVHRTRKLAYRHAQAERDRANLARHFSPNMVDELAHQDQPMGAVRREQVAVLFVDIVGFTRTSENADPEQVIAVLRDFHRRMADRVFAHGGTLDKFLGDGLMVTFGTPYPRPDDAERALSCARDMAAEIAAWNRQRAEAGEPPVRAGIGLHFGPVVLGDIGDERRLEFAVIGDTVNVASRLEAMTRELGVDVIASNDVITQARQGGAAGIFDGLEEGAHARVRGRDDPVAIWTLRAA